MQAVASDWRKASLGEADAALCRWAESVTLAAEATTPGDLAPLRAAGFADRAIHDATQIIAYFNYINRMADALDVDTEDWLHPWEDPEHGDDRADRSAP